MRVNNCHRSIGTFYLNNFHFQSQQKNKRQAKKISCGQSLAIQANFSLFVITHLLYKIQVYIYNLLFSFHHIIKASDHTLTPYTLTPLVSLQQKDH